MTLSKADIEKLYECALAVESETALNTDLAVWEETVGDGLENVGLKNSDK